MDVTSRGKTTPASTQGSYAPHTGGKSRVDLGGDDIAQIDFADVGWGSRYGGDKVWATTNSATILRLHRDGQRCRFYDEHGHQHGPEHANVAPALAHIAGEGFVGTNETLAAAARSAARDRAARTMPPTWAEIRSSRFTPVQHLRTGDLMVVPATIRYDDAPELGEMAVREGVHEAAANATTSGRIATVDSVATRTEYVAGVTRDVSVVTFTDGTTLNAFTTQMFLTPAGEPSDDYKSRVPDTVVDAETAGRFVASLQPGDPLVLEMKNRWTGPLNEGWNTGLIAGRDEQAARSKRRR